MAALVETMFSANNIEPWHRQGEILTGYPTIEEAVKHSGLTWSVGKYPLRAVVSQDDGGTPTEIDQTQHTLVQLM